MAETMLDPAGAPPGATDFDGVDHPDGAALDGTARLDGARLDDAAVEARLARLDEVLGQMELIPGRTAELAMEAVEALTEVYGEALTRMAAAAAQAPPVLAAFTGDELLRHLLLLHGAHPDPAEVRAARAVEDLRAQGAKVTLTEVRDGVARLSVPSGGGCCGNGGGGASGGSASDGGCGCGAGAAADDLGEVARTHVLTMAPELAGVEIVAASPAPALIPIASLSRRPSGGPR